MFVLGLAAEMVGLLIGLLCLYAVAYSTFVPDLSGSPDAGAMLFISALITFFMIPIPLSVIGFLVCRMSSRRLKRIQPSMSGGQLTR